VQRPWRVEIGSQAHDIDEDPQTTFTRIAPGCQNRANSRSMAEQRNEQVLAMEYVRRIFAAARTHGVPHPSAPPIVAGRDSRLTALLLCGADRIRQAWRSAEPGRWRSNPEERSPIVASVPGFHT
jgi:hypothetical protein